MIDLSIGAVGAAIIAGIVSIIGLIIGKEQKVSEFRQSWIDELRKCFVSYLVSINAISDAISLKKSGKLSDETPLLTSYKALNEASHGIILRINKEEATAKVLIKSMEDFEKIAASNDTITPANIKLIEANFIEASNKLLKFEWTRVKKGEKIYVMTKRILLALLVTMIAIFIYLLYFRRSVGYMPTAADTIIQLL